METFFDKVKKGWEASSYPTYEEWKRYTPAYFILLLLRSYPTYEEWKHKFILTDTIPSEMFLSYL